MPPSHVTSELFDFLPLKPQQNLIKKSLALIDNVWIPNFIETQLDNLPKRNQT